MSSRSLVVVRTVLVMIVLASVLITCRLARWQNADYWNRAGSSKGVVNLAMTTCSDAKLEEALALLNSAIIFSQSSNLHVYAFTNDEMKARLLRQMTLLKEEAEAAQLDFTYQIFSVSFPREIGNMTPWIQLFKPCSLQRLFLPELLPDVDAVIYMDADSLILSNFSTMWDNFGLMNDKQLVGATAVTEFPQGSWFSKHSRAPFFGRRGLNTGIMLMNLTRMRSVGFVQHIYRTRELYEDKRVGGDQFLQNVLYSFHPEWVYVLPCHWNVRPIHCKCSLTTLCQCAEAVRNGVSVIHGTKDAFTDKPRLVFFRHAYEIIKMHNFQDDLGDLLAKMKIWFDKEEFKCFFPSSDVFYRRFQTYLENL